MFARRRAALMQAIGPRAALVLHAPPESRRGSVTTRYRQSSDILYLTGFAEPDTTVVIRPGAEKEKFVLFVRPRDKEREVWDGRRAGVEGAVATWGADAAYPVAELDKRLPELLANLEDLHHGLGVDPRFDRTVTAAIVHLRASERRGQRPPRRVIDPRVALHELRLRKSPEEIACLRRAAAVTAEAHIAAMAAGRPGVPEYELEALIEYTFRRRGGAGTRLQHHRPARARTPPSCTTSTTRAPSAKASWWWWTPAARSISTPPTSPARFPPAGPSARSSAAAMSWCWRPRRRRSA